MPTASDTRVASAVEIVTDPIRHITNSMGSHVPISCTNNAVTLGISGNLYRTYAHKDWVARTEETAVYKGDNIL